MLSSANHFWKLHLLYIFKFISLYGPVAAFFLTVNQISLSSLRISLLFFQFEWWPRWSKMSISTKVFDCLEDDYSYFIAGTTRSWSTVLCIWSDSFVVSHLYIRDSSGDEGTHSRGNWGEMSMLEHLNTIISPCLLGIVKIKYLIPRNKGGVLCSNSLIMSPIVAVMDLGIIRLEATDGNSIRGVRW